MRILFAGIALLVVAAYSCTTVTAASATDLAYRYPYDVAAGKCTPPDPESEAAFWVKTAGGLSSSILDALEIPFVGEILETFTEVVAHYNDKSQEQFEYVSCQLESIMQRLEVVDQKLDEIKQLIVTVAVHQAVQQIESSYTSLVLLVKTSPNATKAALDESMAQMYNAIVSQNIIFTAAGTIHYYLVNSASAGVDPLLLSISKNHAKEGLLEYYVNVKKEASAYWDTLGKAMNLLRYAANYKNMSIPLYLAQAKEIEDMVTKEGEFLEEGAQVVIPKMVRDPARAWLANTDRKVSGRMKIRVANGGPKMWSMEPTGEIYQTLPCWRAGRGDVYEPDGTMITWYREDPAKNTYFLSTMSGGGYGMATADINWCYMGDCTFVTERVFTWATNLNKLHAIMPTTLVPADQHLYYVMEELVAGTWKWTCSLKGHTNCGDVLVSDRGSYNDVADDEDCQMEIKWFL